VSDWVRNDPGPRENGIAAAAAVGAGVVVGVAVFYVGRLILARDPLPPRPTAAEDEPERVTGGEGGTRRLGAGRRGPSRPSPETS
jgi:hypothetical protein